MHTTKNARERKMEEMQSRDAFRFVVSPTTTYGVDVDVLLRLGALVDSLSRREQFEKQLMVVVLFPIVADPKMYAQKDFVTHKRKDRAFYVGKNIDHGIWNRARTPGRVKLATDNFQASIEAIPEKQFSNQAKERLGEIIRHAASQIKKR